MRMNILDPFRDWDPFRDLANIERLMNSLWTGYRQTYPPLDMKDETDKIIISAELPGVDKETIELTALRDTLTITGEKKLPTSENVNYIRHERPHGKFRRQIDLPYPIDQEKVSANYKDGILTIILPKAEEAKPRQITVE
ncbi:MAG: Hsp20/alpha crystallin family protein [bacterium]